MLAIGSRPKNSDQIQLAMSTLGRSIALRTGAVHLQTMTAFNEAVLVADFLHDHGDCLVGELDQLAALRANQMVVLRVAVVVFVDLTAVRSRDFAEQARFFQQLERDTRSRD